MTATEKMRRFRRRWSLFTLLVVTLLPLHAWGSIYECRDQEGHRIITDSPSQLEECKTISSTPSPKKSGFGGSQSYGDSSSAVTQSAPAAGTPQYPPVLVTGPNGEVLSEADPSAAQASGSPPQKPDAAQAPVVNQLHPFSPPVAAPQTPPEQKP